MVDHYPTTFLENPSFYDVYFFQDDGNKTFKDEWLATKHKPFMDEKNVI